MEFGIFRAERRSKQRGFQHRYEGREPDETPDVVIAPQDGLLRWLAKFVSKRRVSLALIAALLVVDLVIPWSGTDLMPRWQGLSFVPQAFVDEPCAVATALIVLGAITRFCGAPPDPKLGWSLIAWSVLIDVDHLPQEFGTAAFTEGTSGLICTHSGYSCSLHQLFLSYAIGLNTPRRLHLWLLRRCSSAQPGE